MANRNFPNNKLYQTAIAPARLDLSITVGSSGAVSASSGAYIKSITKLSGAGMYQIRLQDNYYRLIGIQSSIVAPLSGTPVSAGSFVSNTAYRITALGNTTQAQWEAAGFPTGITAAVGASFVATAAGAGSGVVQAIIDPGVNQIVLMDNGAELQSSLSASQNGAVVNVQCFGASVSFNSYTPAGSISAGVIAVAAGTAGDAVTNNAGVLNSVGGEDLAVNAQTFTGTPAVLTGALSQAASNPVSGTILKISILLDSSAVSVTG